LNIANTIPINPTPVATPKLKIDSNTAKFLVGESLHRQPIYWHFGHKGLSNRHLLITGSSGQGKTYTIQTLLAEASKSGVSSVIVDYSDSFTTQQLDPNFKNVVGNKLNSIIVYDGINVNPFKVNEITIDGVKRPEKIRDVAQRVADIFTQVYTLGDQQFSAIYRACINGLGRNPNAMSFDVLRQELENIGDATAKKVLSKVSPFFDGDYLKFGNPIEWKTLTQGDGTVTIIQLSNIAKEIQVAITEFILWDMWYYMQKCSNESTPFIVVLDEAQNLSFKDKSPNKKILLEGRKFGWSAWYSTQFLTGQLDSDEINELCQADTKIFFKPTSNDIIQTAKMVDSTNPKDWVPRLSTLSKGKCIVTHQDEIPNVEDSLSQYKNDIVNVTSFEDRL
jgi:DNA phosphorothioation-dependent restriction protein DptH